MKIAKIISRVVWIFSILFSITAAWTGIALDATAKGAIQEIDIACSALAMTIIPYCIARAVSEILS